MPIDSSDDAHHSSRMTILTAREADVLESAYGYAEGYLMVRLGARRLRDIYRGRPLYELREAMNGTDLQRLGRLVETRRVIEEGTVQVRARAEGSNKVLLQGITRMLQQFRDGTAYRFTHLDMGSSGSAVDEAQTGVVTHVDASVGVPRLPITEKVITGKVLKCSTFIATTEYVGADLREASICDDPSAGTPFNRVLFTTPLLAKSAADVAVANLEHTVNN